MWETSQVSSGYAADERRGDRPALLGAAGVVLAVGAHAEEHLVGRHQPGRPARAQGVEVEVEQVLGPVEHGGLQPALVEAGAGGVHPEAGARSPAVVPPDQQRPHLGPAPRPPAARPSPTGGSRLSRTASTPHGPGFSTSRNDAHGGGRAGDRVAAVEAGRRAAEGHPVDRTSSRPSRTRRRASTRLLWSSRPRSAGVERGAVADDVDRAGDATRARRGDGRRSAAAAGHRPA